MKRILVGVIAVALPLTAFAHDKADQQIGSSGQLGQTTGTTQGAQPGQVSSADQKFVEQAASAGLFEVQSAQLAMQKSQDPQVKAHAQHLLRDHQQANNQLRDIAQNQKLQMPTQMLPEQQKMLSELQSKQGKDFDQTFLSQQKQAHEQAIDLFQKEAKSGQNQALKQFASQTVPTLKMHQQMVSRPSSKM
jgi:putative membrane protein